MRFRISGLNGRFSLLNMFNHVEHDGVHSEGTSATLYHATPTLLVGNSEACREGHPRVQRLDAIDSIIQYLHPARSRLLPTGQHATHSTPMWPLTVLPYRVHLLCSACGCNLFVSGVGAMHAQDACYHTGAVQWLILAKTFPTNGLLLNRGTTKFRWTISWVLRYEFESIRR